MNKLDLTGHIFSHLVAKKEVGRNFYGQVMWLCDCDCGSVTIVPVENLRRGNTKSCGCLKAKQKGQSRKSGTLYQTWRAMMRRCYEPTSHAFKDYGGRGIIVCDRWHEYLNFETDMGGKRPAQGLSLDRINNDGIYEPSNCRWATKQEQASNRRNPWIARRAQMKEAA